MNTRTLVTRWIAVGLLAATVLSVASPAFADRGGRSRRFKGVDNGFPRERVVIRERSSSAGPVIAGLLGGFLLGAAVTSNAQPVVVHEHYHRARPVVVYRYYDPYRDDWYESLDECQFRSYRPRVIQVIEVRSGREVRTLRYRQGHWQSCDFDGEGYDD